MQVICVSRGSQSRGKEFAEKLAAELGYACVSREDLLEEATRRRIPIGKLETAIIKPHIYSEDLAIELDHYKALATSVLCERAARESIVYHGRTGHLLLPGIDHILRIRVVSDMEYRVSYVMNELGLSRDKAKQYIDLVEDDRRKWVKQFYGVEWDVFTLYDLVLNLSQMSVTNAVSATCAMAQLPEFQATPASLKAMANLRLASRARLILASHEGTRRRNVKVRATDGVVNVTYLSQEMREPQVITQALQDIEGVREIVCTEAETNILWIQEAYDLADHSYEAVLSLANTWDAAVELIKLSPTDEPDDVLVSGVQRNADSWPESGVIDEALGGGEDQPEDMAKVYEKLIGDGRAGGRRSVGRSKKGLVNAIDRSVNYRLIIFDRVLLDKDESARKRMLQEWANFLSDSLGTPVVTVKDIVAQHQFGFRQAARMTVLALVTAAILFAVFQFNSEILSFLSRTELKWRVLATGCIFVFVPLFALVYSSAARLFLKMLKLD